MEVLGYVHSALSSAWSWLASCLSALLGLEEAETPPPRRHRDLKVKNSDKEDEGLLNGGGSDDNSSDEDSLTDAFVIV